MKKIFSLVGTALILSQALIAAETHVKKIDPKKQMAQKAQTEAQTKARANRSKAKKIKTPAPTEATK